MVGQSPPCTFFNYSVHRKRRIGGIFERPQKSFVDYRENILSFRLYFSCQGGVALHGRCNMKVSDKRHAIEGENFSEGPG